VITPGTIPSGATHGKIGVIGASPLRFAGSAGLTQSTCSERLATSWSPAPAGGVAPQEE